MLQSALQHTDKHTDEYEALTRHSDQTKIRLDSETAAASSDGAVSGKWTSKCRIHLFYSAQSDEVCSV